MHGSQTVGWLLVAVCGGTGGYCLRWVVGRRGGPAWWRRAAAADAAMGLGMAVMALPGAVAHAAALAVFFAVVVGWAALLLRVGVTRGPHHVVEAAAMVYAAVAMAGAAGGEASGPHAAHAPGAGLPWLTGALLAYVGYRVLRAGPRLVAAAGPDGAEGAGVAASRAWRRPPRVAAACRLALSLATLVMLLTL